MTLQHKLWSSTFGSRYLATLLNYEKMVSTPKHSSSNISWCQSFLQFLLLDKAFWKKMSTFSYIWKFQFTNTQVCNWITQINFFFNRLAITPAPRWAVAWHLGTPHCYFFFIYIHSLSTSIVYYVAKKQARHIAKIRSCAIIAAKDGLVYSEQH